MALICGFLLYRLEYYSVNKKKYNFFDTALRRHKHLPFPLFSKSVCQCQNFNDEKVDFRFGFSIEIYAKIQILGQYDL